MGWIVFLYPLMELWSLIELGAQTTAGTAVLWVLVAGLVGLGAIRFAGTQVLTRLQAAQREGALQQHLLAGDMALAFAGLAADDPGLDIRCAGITHYDPTGAAFAGQAHGFAGSQHRRTIHSQCLPASGGCPCPI